MPRITVQICTYNRPQELRYTLRGLWENIVYDGPIHLHISDDSSPGSYRDDLYAWLASECPWQSFRVQSTPRRGGWGLNVNTGLQHIEDDIIFFCEDDYLLTRNLHLSPAVEALEYKGHNYGLIRFDGIAGHNKVLAKLDEIVLRSYYWYRQGDGSVEGKYWLWRLSPHSEQYYIYSNRPHLKHRRFHDFYGLYPTGLQLGQTEQRYCMMVRQAGQKDIAKAPKIGVPIDWCIRYWDDIGTSYQHTKEDIKG